MKIQLKRSNVLDGTTAKEPTADQMEYGELAVNYNEDDPAIFLKGSDNTIVRIAGTGAYGKSSVTVSDTPPSSPANGDLWWNSTNTVAALFIWYEDVDSNQWVEATGSDADLPLWIRNGTTVEPATTGDSVAVGGTSGAPNITLDADGSAEFAGRLDAGGIINSGSDTTRGTFLNMGAIVTQRALADVSTAGLIIRALYGQTEAFSVTCGGDATFAGDVSVGDGAPTGGTGFRQTADGLLRIGRDLGDGEALTVINTKIGSAGIVLAGSNSLNSTGQTNDYTSTIFTDGSAKFASGVINLLNGNNTKGISCFTDPTGAKASITLRSATTPDQARGRIELTAADTATGDNQINFTAGTVSNPDNITLNANGSINANGNIAYVIPNEAQHYLGRNSSKSFNGLRLQVASTSDTALNPTMIECKSRPAGVDTVTVDVKADGTGTFAGIVKSSNGTAYSDLQNGRVKSVRETSSLNEVWAGGFGDTTTSTITALGSATFAGNVACGGDASNAGKETGCLITKGGQFVARNTSGNSALWGGYLGSNGSPTSLIRADGSADFDGNVSATIVPPSDARFKENITPAKPQLADVVALGGLLKNYDWNDQAPLNEELRSQRQLGLVAQEVAEVCPTIVKDINRTKTVEVTPAVTGPKGRVITEAVTKEEDDSYKGISQEALIMKLIGAVAELKAEVDALKTA